MIVGISFENLSKAERLIQLIKGFVKNEKYFLLML